MAAKKGDKVKVHYTGTTDGRMFDSSEGKEPLEFVVGKGTVIKGFDKAVEGMEVNEEKEVNIPCAKAYGEPHDELKKEIPKAQFPPNVPLKIGTMLIVQGPSGQKMPVRIADVKEDSVVVDFNHPLSGKDLTFKIKLVEVVE